MNNKKAKIISILSICLFIFCGCSRNNIYLPIQNSKSFVKEQNFNNYDFYFMNDNCLTLKSEQGIQRQFK